MGGPRSISWGRRIKFDGAGLGLQVLFVSNPTHPTSKSQVPPAVQIVQSQLQVIADYT